MGSAASTTNVPEILKGIWQDEVFDFHYEDCALVALMPKDTTWDGEYQMVTVHYGGSPGRSTDFGTAKSNKGPPKYKRMQIYTRDNFAVWSVDHKLITLSRNQKGALVRALAETTEKAHSKIKRSNSWMLWRNGGGAIGKIASISTNTLTLSDINDVRNMDLDDVHVFSNDDGTGGAGTLVGRRTVTAINEDTGVITYDADLTTIAGLGANDFVFPEGDYNGAFYGVDAYVTQVAPGTGGVPAAIHGMTRTDHPTRLAGHRFTAATANVADEIKTALAKAWRRNCNVSHLFAAPEVIDEVEAEIGVNRRYVDVEVGRVGFKALEFTTQSKKVLKLIPDADIPKSKANGRRLVYGLNLSRWKFHTALEMPMWLNINNNKDFMTEENANSSEGRIGGYGQPYTDAPGDNFVLELTA